jgi:hypothetical protein
VERRAALDAEVPCDQLSLRVPDVMMTRHRSSLRQEL